MEETMAHISKVTSYLSANPILKGSGVTSPQLSLFCVMKTKKNLSISILTRECDFMTEIDMTLLIGPLIPFLSWNNILFATFSCDIITFLIVFKESDRYASHLNAHPLHYRSYFRQYCGWDCFRVLCVRHKILLVGS